IHPLNNKLSFIRHLSAIVFTPQPLPPPAKQVTGITKDSTWSWFLTSLGRHKPALPDNVKLYIRSQFELIPITLRQWLLRPDLLADHVHQSHHFRVGGVTIRMLYQLHTAIRQLAPYADEHQLWLPEAELYWFWMREGMWDVLMFKIADFPVSMPFGLGRPYQTPSNGQSQTITLDSLSNHRRTPDDNNAEDHYWPLHFHSMTPLCQARPTLGLCRNGSINGLGIDLPAALKELAHSWIENAACGRHNHVLFQKTSQDRDIGILLWPSFPHGDCQPTLRIPVFSGDIVQLVKGDRLLIFAGPKGCIEDAILQISITCEWASTYLPGPCKSLYADKKYTSQILASGEYPHSVKHPIYGPSTAPEPKIHQGCIIPMSTYESNQVPEGKRTQICEVPETVLSRAGKRGYIKQYLIMPHTSLDLIPWPSNNLNNPWYEGVYIYFLMTLDHLEELALGVRLNEVLGADKHGPGSQSDTAPAHPQMMTVQPQTASALLEAAPAHPQTVEVPPANGSRSTKRKRHGALDPPGDSKRPRGIQSADKNTLDEISRPTAKQMQAKHQ
ncbi:hypothetical protein MJO29_003176, partial [Puccinia striiformis f. sp. tritici]